MKFLLLPLVCFGLAFTGWTGEPGRAGVTGREPGFRVRSDFSAGLNHDQGWAAALNENVVIRADQPFRLRFEVEHGAGAGVSPYGLQYRRNGGDWTPVEAHDFPYPKAEFVLDFSADTVGGQPAGWRVAEGDQHGLTVVAEAGRKVLRTRAGGQPLLATYPPPWDLNNFALAAQIRIPAGSRGGAALVFGDFARQRHVRVLLDPVAGAIRVSRFSQGNETVVAERPANITPGEWLELEVQYENGGLEVNFQDDTVEFTVPMGADVARTQVGFHLPANGAADFREFAIEGEPGTPRVSIVACAAYENGAVATDLLRGAGSAYSPGCGVSLAPRAPATPSAASTHSEYEWAVVVRRFADGALTNEEDDTFEFRMFEPEGGRAVTTRNPRLRLTIPPGHLGGTYVETPGRIGPWRAANGDLYFIMEPAETDNLFMMVKSTDEGRTWREVDGAHRPATGDLESVDGRQVGDTIHLIHQVTESVRYHSFRTSDHPTHPDTWHVRDERAAAVESVAQGATLVARSDGSLVTFFVGATVHYAVRAPTGAWSPPVIVDSGRAPNLAGPKAALGAGDTVHVACYGMDGTIWYRRLRRDGTLTERQLIASGIGATRAEFGAVLPLVFLPETDTLVIVYQQADGTLWERRVIQGGPPTPPVRITRVPVIRDAVDSQQPAADAVRDGQTVHVLFVDAKSRGIFSTQDRGGWQPPVRQIGDILGSWVRGNVFTRRDGVTVYGYVYDAGSHGGAGMNRYGELILKR